MPYYMSYFRNLHLKIKKTFFSEDCITRVGILVYFSSSCGQIPDKKKLKGSDVYFGSGVSGHLGRKAFGEWQEQEAACS